MKRAYSLLEIKDFDDDRREITGIATTPTPDRMGDIVESMGAKFKLPIPLLWQHDHTKPVGEVYAARPTKSGIPISARVFKSSGASVNLRERLEEAWESLKIGLVKGLSIGFNPIDYEPIADTYSLRFKTWEWLELSAVTIPANAEADIQTIKSLDERMRAASGREQTRIVRLDEGIKRRVSRSPGVVYLGK